MKQNRNLDSVMEPETISKNGASSKSRMSRRCFIQRTFLFLVTFCIFTTNVFAQDVITLKNGDDIQALVQEVGEVEIKYKKFDNLEGPNYTMKKTEIFMIRYANGSKDVFTDISEPVIEPAKTSLVEQKNNYSQTNTRNENTLLSVRNAQVRNQNGVQLRHSEIMELMKTEPMALENYKRGASNRRVGKGLAVPGLIFCGVGIGLLIGHYATPEYDRDPDMLAASTGFFGLSIAFNIPSIILSSSGNRRIETAVDIYNNSIQRQRSQNMSLNFGITQSGGIGLTLNF